MGLGGIIVSYCIGGVLILGCILGTVLEFVMLFSNGLQILPLLGSLISLVGICVGMARDRIVKSSYDDFSESLQYALIFGAIQFLFWLPIRFVPEDDRMGFMICVVTFGQAAKCLLGREISSLYEEDLKEKAEKYRAALLAYYQKQAEALNRAIALIQKSAQTAHAAEKLVDLFDRCGYPGLRTAFCRSDNNRNRALMDTLKRDLRDVGLDLVQHTMTTAQVRRAIEAQIPRTQEKIACYGDEYFSLRDFRQIKAAYESIDEISKARKARKAFWKTRAWKIAAAVLVVGLSSGSFYFFHKVDRIYSEARMQQENGHYVAAAELLESIQWYKDADALLEDQKYDAEHEKIRSANVGDVVEFGECPNDTFDVSGKVEWIVLAKNDGKVLLLSKDILTHRPYHNKTSDVTWEDSALRSWLNMTFYATIFCPEEREWIEKTQLKNQDNALYYVPGGQNTEDRIFLLSISETSRLLRSREASDRWWLRSPGKQKNYAALVSEAGRISSDGAYAAEQAGVRPAMWVS